MKKYLFIFGLVGTALFTACSSADDLVADIPSQGLTEEEKAMILEAGQDSEVPIMLGMLGKSQIAMTRTPIESGGSLLFETPANTYLGVYCLARGKQDEDQQISGILPATNDDINWATSKYANWMGNGNVPARVVKYITSNYSHYPSEKYSEVQFMTNIDTTPEQINYYYPFGNWYYYNFYAYYPRSESVTIDKDNVYANISINGKVDVIHGMASSDDNTHALEKALPYSAKYFRLEKGNNATVPFASLPQLQFKHKLAKIEVYIKAHDAKNASALTAREVKVKSATISGVYSDLTLCVASKISEGNPTGKLAIKDGSPLVELDLSKVDAGADVSPFAGGKIAVTSSEAYVGYVMIPPTALLADNDRYTITLGMEQKNGEPLPDFIVVMENTDGTRMALDEGKSYKVTLDVYSPSEIIVKATLERWDNVELPALEVE